MLRILLLSLTVAFSVSACASPGATGTSDLAEDAATDDSADLAIQWSFPAKEIPEVDQEEVGNGPEGAVILSATDVPRPDRVAVYLHQWTPLPPNAEAEAIIHLIEAGNTVVYPAYQDHESKVTEYLPNAVSGLRTALDALDFEPSAIVAIGATTGGALAFDLAAVAEREGLPSFDAAVAINPGRKPTKAMPRPDYSAIPATTSLLSVHTSGSRIPQSAREARRMIRLATTVPDSRKRFFRATAAKTPTADDLWRHIRSFIANAERASLKGGG